MPLPIPCDCTPAGHRCPRLYPPHLRPFPGAGVRRDSGAWPAAPSPRRSSAGTVSVQSDYHFRGLAKLLTAPAQCATAICCTGPKVKPRWNPQIRCGRLKRQHTGNGRSLGTAVPRPRWPFCGSCAHTTRHRSWCSGTMPLPMAVTPCATTSAHPSCNCGWCACRPTALISKPMNISGPGCARK